jgi:hypothetical protein
VEREGGIIIRVTIIRGATIKVSIFGTGRCTQRIRKTREKSYPENSKIRTLAGR